MGSSSLTKRERALKLGDMLPKLQSVLAPPGEYSRIDQEPNIELRLRSQRHEGDPVEKSRWEFAYALEGERDAPITLTQAQWSAAMLRWAADLIEGPVAEGDSPKEQIEGYAARLSARMLTDMKELALVTEWLVERCGLDHAAFVLSMSVPQVRELHRSFKPLLLEHPKHGRRRLERSRRDVVPALGDRVRKIAIGNPT